LPKFEECLQRLEKIVDQLEKGEIPLEQALKLFEEGIELSNNCRKELEDAEGKVEILLKQNGKSKPSPSRRLPILPSGDPTIRHTVPSRATGLNLVTTLA